MHVGIFYKKGCIGPSGVDNAKLVAKKYSQVEGVDFNEAFSSIIKFTTIPSSLPSQVHSWDYDNPRLGNAANRCEDVFLKPYLEEAIYIDQPQGFVQEGQ